MSMCGRNRISSSAVKLINVFTLLYVLFYRAVMAAIDAAAKNNSASSSGSGGSARASKKARQ